MPINKKYLADLNENGIYHIYNRTNNKEKLFLSDENRYFFLKRYDHYLSPFIDTYCWCLLTNHFHFLNKVKSIKQIQANLSAVDFFTLTATEQGFLKNQIPVGILIEQSFKRFFQSYSLSFNNYHRRQGNLFYRSFKRVGIEDDRQFRQAIVYIHANPVKHKLINDFTKYPWSSWHSLLSNAPTRLLRSEVMDAFGSRNDFINTHKKMISYYEDSDIAIED